MPVRFTNKENHQDDAQWITDGGDDKNQIRFDGQVYQFPTNANFRMPLPDGAAARELITEDNELSTKQYPVDHPSRT